jgi:phosphoribosyl 1,2-cyclic phosphodiesterase
MKICTLSSSSSGNCTLVSHGETHILVDAGISMRRTGYSLKSLDIDFPDLSGIIVTHEHSDHICGLKMISKYHKVPIYAPEGVGDILAELVPEAADHILHIKSGVEIEINDISIKGFKTPHDTPESFGYRITAGGRSLVFATDLGHVSEEVLSVALGADFAVIEANHDTDMLWNGPYPYFLKKRVTAKHGHLSNADCSEFARLLVQSGTRHITLAHLSRTNNTPARALKAVKRTLLQSGAMPGKDVYVNVAPASDIGVFPAVG